jgi:peptide chain release factor subunit 1
MELTRELRELAKFTAGGMPVVSLYLDTQWRDQHQRERAAVFLRQHLHSAQALAWDSGAAQESLARDLERIRQWGEQCVQGAGELHTAGHALFACYAADLWVDFPSPVPFEDEFAVAEWPVLGQLARLDEDYASALVVMVDSRAARVYEVLFGGILAEIDFRNEVPGRHKQGGWAQMRYQRHIKDHIDRHHKEVASYLSTVLTERPNLQIIVSGQNDLVANLRQALPGSLQERILDTVQLDIRANRQRILELTQEVLQRHEHEEEQASVDQVLSRAGQGGLAVLGRQATVAAANTGRIHQLVMNRSMHAPGWRCVACGYMGEEAAPAQCPACQAQVSTVDLGEALVSTVLRHDGFVEMIEPDARLQRYEGVGAILRYR